MGNRGCLHRPDGTPTGRIATTKAWIVCRLSFKGRRRPVMAPGRYTELFFLDEATAFAAGHRPCAECRREAFNAFRDGRRAPEIDASLDAERGRVAAQRPPVDLAGDRLPDGVFVVPDHDPGEAYLVAGGGIHRWSFSGYGPQRPLTGKARVLTPSFTIARLDAGYPVHIHRFSGA